MKLNTKTVLTAYGAFAVVNLGLAYLAAKRPAGSSALLDFNNRLLAYNVLARIFPPPLQPMVTAGTPQLAIPTGATVTDQESGMTTTYNV